MTFSQQQSADFVADKQRIHADEDIMAYLIFRNIMPQPRKMLARSARKVQRMWHVFTLLDNANFRIFMNKNSPSNSVEHLQAEPLSSTVCERTLYARD